MKLKKILLYTFLSFIFLPVVKTQTYYSGKMRSRSTSVLSIQDKGKQKKRKKKIYVRQTIDSTSILIEVIIKDGNKKKKTSREYKRYILGKHYPDFRLFVKKRNNDEVRYIKPGEDYALDLYDGILRSLLPDFEFYHEKTHRTFFNRQLEDRYNIAFDIIKEKEENIFKHKFQYAKTLELTNFFYSADGIKNSKNKIEMIKIESVFWKGSSARPFRQDNNWIELAQIRKKRTLRKTKKLFKKTK